MIQVLDRLSWPGSPDRANEDAAGAAGDWAWVLDGTIVDGRPPVLHPGSDAAWLVGFASGRFEALAPTAADGVALVRRVMTEARAVFLAAAPPARRDPLTWPIAALTLLRRRADALDFWTFGDTTAYLQDGKGAVTAVGAPTALREAETAAIAGLMAETEAPPGALLDAEPFRAWVRKRRGTVNTPDGPALFGLEPHAAEGLVHQSLPLAGETLVLLASDGFSALVELYGRLDPRACLEAALASGLEPLAREVRRIETELDPGGRRYPRAKQSDDLTALLVRATSDEA